MKTDERAEQHFFLEVKRDRPVYCVKYLPEKDHDKRLGVILCKPIWGERIRIHRIFTNLARMLSAEGFSVITCDYFGDGNSGGETIDLNYYGMVDDIVYLHRYFESENKINTFVLLGLRLGANIAIGAEKGIVNLHKMILFEPILNPIDFFKQALRANLSTQMVVHKKIVKTRDELIKDLKNGIPVNIDGFVIGKQLWESFEQISPLKFENDFHGYVAIYSMVARGRKGTDYSQLAAKGYGNSRYGAIEQEFIWTDWKYYIPKPPIFFETVKSELDTVKQGL